MALTFVSVGGLGSQAHAQDGETAQNLVQYTTGTLKITGTSGVHPFTIEIAKDDRSRAQGLMFRRQMAPYAGMLFVYDSEQPVAFWMHNTLIPLDMVFIGADHRISAIHERAVPMDDTPISSGPPALAVLELNGGTVGRLGIKNGELVTSAALP